MTSLTLGTRGSALALKQTELVTAALQLAHANSLNVLSSIIHTSGDLRLDLRFSEFSPDTPKTDKGIFIKELEQALLDGSIDAAVHSLKDVPSVLLPEFSIAAYLPRADIEDVLISKTGYTLESLPKNAKVGTSSVRRKAQLLQIRPDCEVLEIRGNVATRIKKLSGESALDAIILASAGVSRLNYLDPDDSSSLSLDSEHLYKCHHLDPLVFLPAAGQGAIAIECLTDSPLFPILQKINHQDTFLRVTTERLFLEKLGAGCQTPVGIHTSIQQELMHLRALVYDESNLSATPPLLTFTGPADQPHFLADGLFQQHLHSLSH